MHAPDSLHHRWSAPVWWTRLSAWSAVSGLAGRMCRYAKGIELQEAVSAAIAGRIVADDNRVD